MSKRTLIADLVSLEDHLEADVCLTKSGGVHALFAVDGIYPHTADEVDIVRWFETLHVCYQNLYADDVTFSTYLCRGDAVPMPEEVHPSSFAQALATEYRANLDRHSSYTNRLFLGVTIRAPSAMRRRLSQFLSDVPTNPRAGVAQRTQRLAETCELVHAQLARFGLRRLGYAERNHILFDEIAEAYARISLGLDCPVGVTTGRMATAMFSERIHFRHRHLEIDSAGAPYYGLMMALKDYPTHTWPGRFETFATAQYRCTVAQSFQCMSTPIGMDLVTRKQNKRLIARDRARTQTHMLDHAAEELQNGEWFLGDHSLVVLAFADHRTAIDMVGNAVWRDIANMGIKAVRLTRTLQSGWLSMFPDGERSAPRPGSVSSRNFVAFSPMYNFPAGDAQGLWGPPIATFRTVAGTPYRFHWHDLDRGNTLVTGETGSGKTTGVGFLLALSANRAKVIALDHKRGWQFLARELGGAYTVLGPSQPNFAPLKSLEPTPQNVDFLIALFRDGCIGGVVTQEEGRRLALWLNAVWPHLPVEQRSIGELRAVFDDEPEGAGRRLEPWIWGNELGWVLDAPEDRVRFSRFSVYDTTELLDNRHASGPALSYLFHLISMAADGSPLLIPCDEGHRILEHPFFRSRIQLLTRTLRSKNGAIVFITQSPADIADSEIVRVLTEQCPNQLHFANPRGSRADYVDGLHLTNGQYEAFRELQSGQGMFLHIQGTRSVVAQLPLRGMDDYLRVLSAREEDLRQEDGMLLREAAE